MKKKLSLIIPALLFAACNPLNPDPGTDPGTDPAVEPVTLSLSSQFGSRTTLGTLSNGVYPVYWSNGDRICVNGVKSTTLHGLADKTVTADFTVEGVTAPFHIVYPSLICDAMDAAGKASIQLPVAQAWIPGSFANLSAVLYGSTEGTGAELQNLCGVVRIPLCKGSEFGGTIRTITLSSASPSAPLSGSFTLDTTNGSLEAVEGGSSVFLSLPPEGVALSEESPVSFFLSLPAGRYPDGFSILLESAEGNMLCSWTEQTEVPAGIVVSLPQINFKPKSTKLIDGIDSWNEFATAMNAGDSGRWIDPETGEINLVADISYGGDLVMVNELPAGVVFNGGGHTIKRANATEPLFLLVAEGATLKNLTVGGARVAASSVEDRGTGNLAAFNRGTIENCASDMAVTLTKLDKNCILAGLVTDNAGVLQDCSNNGDISVTFNISANRIVYGGGVAARGQRNLGDQKCSGQFINCENRGNIVIKRSATGIFSFTKFAIGGICGIVTQGNSDGVFSHFENCTNSGSITCWQDDKHTNTNYAYSVGGIVGRSCVYSEGPDFYYFIGGTNATSYEGNYLEIVNCNNTGTIDVSIYSATVANNMSGARQVYVGGIAGCMQSNWADRSVIRGCNCAADIRVGHAARADCTGGIVGGVGYVDISNCKTNVNISLSKNNLYAATYMGVGGGIAGFVMRDTKIADCDITLNYDFSGASYIGAGFVGLVAKNSNIKANVENNGFATLTLEGTNWFSGSIGSSPVTAENVAYPSSLGVINGSITIK
ncbi:MAG: hypothetical protein J5764_05845 [Bacteroidales bacterium]|nr:hypothetical protein [Bacteroidales bacterium]